MGSKDLLLLGVTGLPSSGKGVFSIEAKKMGFQEVVMGDVIRNEVKRRNLELNRENSNRVMLDLRKERGADAVALITLDWIAREIQNGENRIIIDGIRSMAEVRTMRKVYPQLIVIAIHADPKTRYNRARGRNRQDDASTQESFDRRDKIELSVGIGDVVALSDIMVSSQGEIDEIRAIYSELLEDLISKTEIGLTTDV